VDLLFHTPVQTCAVAIEFLNRIRPYALTRNVAGAYMGYLTEQIRRGFKPSTPQNPDRKAQLEALGYDAKYLMHFFRLSYTLSSILIHHRYDALSERDIEFLRNVREGYYDKEWILDKAQRDYEKVQAFYNEMKDDLPDTTGLERVIPRVFQEWIQGAW
jgi:hypothetical protein